MKKHVHERFWFYLLIVLLGIAAMVGLERIQ